MSTETKKEDKILSSDDLEKSWNDSKSLLKSLLDDEDNDSETDAEKLKKSEEDKKKAEELEKAKKEKKKETESDLFEEDEEDEDDDEEGMHKSIEDELSSDEETSAAMDVEPFLRKLTKSISNHFKKIEATIEKENKQLKKENQILAKSMIALGDQSISIASVVEEIANTPIGSTSVLRKSKQKYEDQNKGMELLKGMSNDEIMEKAVELSKSRKLSPLDISKIQTRINHGMPLEEHYIRLLATTKEEK